MSEKITPQEYYKDFPEAPFSDTFKWVDSNGYEHMITVRSWSATSLIQAIKQTQEHIGEFGGTPPTKMQPKQASNEPTYHPVEEGLQTLLVAKVEVTPKPDNKVELKLYGENDKYPRLYHNGTVEQVLTALSTTGLDWKKEQLTVASSINAKFFADWRNSEKLNSNGKPYKNIVGYREA